MSRKVPHRVECLTLSWTRGHRRDRIATSVWQKGGRVAVEIGRVSVGRAPHLAMDKEDSDLREAEQGSAAILS
jgi:hypothetical protein